MPGGLDELRPLLSDRVATRLGDQAGGTAYGGGVEGGAADAIAFGSPTAELVRFGIVNGSFSQGPPNPDANIDPQNNPLPYWSGPTQASGGAITCSWAADADSPSGRNLRFTINQGGAAADEAYVEQIVDIGGSRTQALAHGLRASFYAVSGTSLGVGVSLHYLDVDFAEVGDPQGGMMTELTGPSLAPYLAFLQAHGEADSQPPSEARYLRVRIHVYRSSMATSATGVVDVADVRLDHAVGSLLIAETGEDFGVSYGPGRIRQIDGEMHVQPNSGSAALKVSQSVVAAVSTLRVDTNFNLAGIVFETLSGNVNNWSPSGIENASVVAIDVSGGPWTVSGFDAADWAEGTVKFFAVSSGTVTLPHGSGSSTSGNRLGLAGAVSQSIDRGGFIVIYLPTMSAANPFRVIALSK